MTYEVDVGSVREELEALPRRALVDLAELVAVLEVAPWSGAPLVDRNPRGAVRAMAFGTGGLVTHVVVEHLARVDLLQMHWVA